MKIALRLGLLAAVAAVGFWLWTVWFPSPERAALKQVARLAQTASFTAQNGMILRAAKATSLPDYFSTNVQITLNVPELPERTWSGREEIRETAAAAYGNLKALSVQFLDATARAGADRQSVEVTSTARVRVNDNQDYGVQELRFQLQKFDRQWLITRVETIQALR